MALLLNEYPYSDYQKINLDWVLDLCNKLKSDAENGVFDGPRGYSVLGGENVIISRVVLGDLIIDYGVSRNYIPDAQIGDFVIGRYNNILSIMLITGIDASETVFYGTSVTSLQGPQGPQGEPGVGGLTEAMKQALLQLARKVAYIDNNGQTYYNALYTALYGGAPAVVVDSISAVFNQGSTVVYDTDTLDSLKQYLVVTATYSDSSTATVPSADYMLSGTLSAGTSTISVNYSGKSATFTVTVTHNEDADWDYIWNYTDGSPEYHDFTVSHAGGSQWTAEMRSDGFYMGANSGITVNLISSFLSNKISENSGNGVVEYLFNIPLYSGTNAINFPFFRIADGTAGVCAYFRTQSGVRTVRILDNSAFASGTVIKTGWDYDTDYTVRLEMNNGIGKVYMDDVLIRDNITISTILWTTDVQVTAQNGENANGFYLKKIRCKYSNI